MLWIEDRSSAKSLYGLWIFEFCEPNYDVYLKMLDIEFGMAETFAFTTVYHKFINGNIAYDFVNMLFVNNEVYHVVD